MTDTSKIVVRPVRFTDNLQPMQAFLEILGLRPRVEAEAGGWVDMVAGAGMVALHSAADSDSGGLPGQTRLSFEADDVHALAKSLEEAGVEEVTVYDESYGQILTCRDPLGDQVHIDGHSHDLYGYRLHPLHVDIPLTVLPVRFTDPRGRYGDFLRALGLRLRGEADEHYTAYAAENGDHGLVGLHFVYTEQLPIVPGPGAAHLTFETTEPIFEVANRLSGKGFAAQVTQEDFGSMLSATDPDGQEIQVHQAPEKPA
ncbi:MAG: VOC family protein [Nocardioidaceae bacterium]